ncbi:hypothetical protein EFP18_01500 [Burkholderia glumae]|uniref:hypothetical protein n=1 Tax=Burkholderia glumae TaxID=337 RepID=UPI000F5FA30B|nr:hypothetical protein [Burkholderia glumae]MCQ0033138.1 hypothetical protein [Burkholderia glumae]MCQ0037719.1 hypothetical protein [Burkholderia glumae]QJW78970.1 hypothetical protein GAS18_09525 [Burkholderia glumae]RQZ66176.1 hypothetical protein DF052_25835 [Burkholderia glumae]UVS82964.1 hypothetical protein EFP18_01500 [Burkholderia glumae]
MKSIRKLGLFLTAALISSSAFAGWQNYETITLDGVANSIPGGNYYHELTIPTGVYRFRIDPTSPGVDYATNENGNTNSKSAALMIYDRTATTDKTAQVSYYGLNANGIDASGVIHAVEQTAGFDLFLQDWAPSDNSGTVRVIIEKWSN